MLSAWQALLPPFCTLNFPSLAHLPVREQLSAPSLRQPLGTTSEQTKQRLFSCTSPWEPSLIHPPRTDHSPGHGADHSVVTFSCDSTVALNREQNSSRDTFDWMCYWHQECDGRGCHQTSSYVRGSTSTKDYLAPASVMLRLTLLPHWLPPTSSLQSLSPLKEGSMGHNMKEPPRV